MCTLYCIDRCTDQNGEKQCPNQVTEEFIGIVRPRECKRAAPKYGEPNVNGVAELWVNAHSTPSKETTQRIISKNAFACCFMRLAAFFRETVKSTPARQSLPQIAGHNVRHVALSMVAAEKSNTKAFGKPPAARPALRCRFGRPVEFH